MLYKISNNKYNIMFASNGITLNTDSRYAYVLGIPGNHYLYAQGNKTIFGLHFICIVARRYCTVT